MNIDFDAGTDREPFTADSTPTSLYHNSSTAVSFQEGQTHENLSFYPRELTQTPTYVDRLPAKKIKGAFSSLITGSLKLTVLERTDRTEDVHPEHSKIIAPNFGSMAAELLQKAA